MKKRWLNVVILSVCFVFLAGLGICCPFAGENTAHAASGTVSYTLTKGKTAKIAKVTKNSKLLNKKKIKAAELTWKSKNKKIARVVGNKIEARKKGTARIVGYDKDKKKVITLRVKVKQPPKPALVRNTMYGKVRGKRTSSGKSMIWYGIPYGADTGGSNRWRAPQSVTSWTGIRNAKKAKKKALKYSSDSSGYEGTSDCLYVNVYRPYTTEKDLPVLVYLHGGGNCSGTANIKFSQMASSMNVVVVSVSFRVGAFGFLSHPALQNGTAEENSGNFALLDIQEALIWLQLNAAYFGGDADNVTLSGFSGGARNVLMCMLSPGMEGLFHKAFVISGGFTLSTQEEGKKVAEKKLADILVNRGTFDTKQEAKEYLKMASDDVIRKLFYSLSTAEVAGMYKSFDLRLSKFPQGFSDGTVLPENWVQALSSGNYNRVPLLIGSDATEFSSFAWNDDNTFSGEELVKYNKLLTDVQNMMEIGIRYGSMFQSCFYLEETADAIGKDSGHAPIYAFRMKWGTTASVSDDYYSRFAGAYHGQIRDFLLGTYKHRLIDSSPDAVSEKNKIGRQALTDQMRQYLYQFMVRGNPNGGGRPRWNKWNSQSSSNGYMSFDAKKKKVISAMSTELYNRNNIYWKMQSELSEQECSLIIDSLLKGRFFMP